MGARREIDADTVHAQVMADRAANGDLIELGKFKLQDLGDQHRINVSRNAVRNLSIGQGDEATAFVDYQRGIVVYDFGGTVDRGEGE